MSEDREEERKERGEKEAREARRRASIQTRVQALLRSQFSC